MSRKKFLLASTLALAVAASTAHAADPATPSETTELAAQVRTLQAQVAVLQAKQAESWLTEEKTEQIKAIVRDVLEDAKTHGQFDDPGFGYKDGFFIQTPEGNFKAILNGLVQARYEFTYHHNPSKDLHPLPTEIDESGFDVRRARIRLSGNVFSPDIIYNFYGDFYGASTGAFTVLEAFAGYNFNDQFKIRAGAMKMPFTRVGQDADSTLLLMSRPEAFTAMSGIDSPRVMGVSLYGNLLQNAKGDATLNYEVQVNNGASSNTFRRPDTTGTTANLDNRLGIYARVNWAGSGTLKDFNDEPDLRTGDRNFVWLLGGAVGYESQNASTNGLPSPQTTAVIGGVANKGKPGFETITLNGDVFRATLDWSAKWQGWSFQAAGLFQQVNSNPGTGVTQPFSSKFDESFFQHGYYAQVGYMLIPQKLELAARADYVLTEGGSHIGEYYTLGANYYIFKHNAKIQTDITYTPESAFTDAGENQLQNTHEVMGRVQFQVSF